MLNSVCRTWLMRVSGALLKDHYKSQPEVLQGFFLATMKINATNGWSFTRRNVCEADAPIVYHFWALALLPSVGMALMTLRLCLLADDSRLQSIDHRRSFPTAPGVPVTRRT